MQDTGRRIQAMIRPLIHTLIYGSVYISLCAVALCMETNLLLHLPLDKIGFYGFVFSSCLLLYNIHYYIKRSANPGSRRFAWSLRHRRVHQVFMALGLLGIGLSLGSLSIRHWVPLGFVILLSGLYSFPLLPFRGKRRLKDFGLLKILVLSLVWTLVTVWFPVVHTASLSPAFLLVFIRRFLFLFVLCLAFDIRDIPIDTLEKIHTLPVMIGMRNCYLLIYACLILIVGLSVLFLFSMPGIGYFLAMTLSSLMTYFMVDYSRTHRSDLVFLAGVDGMMLIQALLVLLAAS